MARRPGLYPLDRPAYDPRLTPVTPEADIGGPSLGDFEDDRGGAFARLREVGRLLDTVRVIDQLKELGAIDPNQLRDIGQWIEGGEADTLANPFGVPGRRVQGSTPNPGFCDNQDPATDGDSLQILNSRGTRATRGQGRNRVDPVEPGTERA